MSKRFEDYTHEKKKAGEKLFCAFLTLGFPNLKVTKALIPAFEKAGVDILELGFPFSDPLADGPTIQSASEDALKNGIRIKDAFETLQGLRSKGLKMPVVFFSYYNPIFDYGTGHFLRDASKAGFDGVVIPDLPPDQETSFNVWAEKYGMSPVYLIAPTTSDARSRMIAKKSKGFIYYVSLRGVTGARKALPEDVGRHLRKLKKMTQKPILVGFGVSTPEQAKSLSRESDGVIVGSAIIECVRRSSGKREPVERFVRKLVRAAKGG